jgi:hypothetical protein
MGPGWGRQTPGSPKLTKVIRIAGLAALGISPFVLFILLLPPSELDAGIEDAPGVDLATRVPLVFPYEAVSPPNQVVSGLEGTESPTLVTAEDRPAPTVRRAAAKRPETVAPAPLPAPVITAGDLIPDPQPPKPDDDDQDRPRRRAAGPPTNEDLNINIGDDTPDDAGPDESDTDPVPQEDSAQNQTPGQEDSAQNQNQTPGQQDSAEDSGTPEE